MVGVMQRLTPGKSHLGGTLAALATAAILGIGSLFAAPAANASSPDDSPQPGSSEVSVATEASTQDLLSGCVIIIVIKNFNQLRLSAGSCAQVRARIQKFHQDFGYLNFDGSWGSISDTGNVTTGAFIAHYEMHETPEGTFVGWNLT